MGVHLLSRQVMAGLLVLAGFLAVLGGVVGAGDDPIEGAGRVLWLVGVVAALVGAGAGGFAIAAGAPVWLRAVACVGAAGLVAVVLTALVPDLDAGPATAVLLGVVFAGVGAWVHVATRRRSVAGTTGLTT